MKEVMEVSKYIHSLPSLFTSFFPLQGDWMRIRLVLVVFAVVCYGSSVTNILRSAQYESAGEGMGSSDASSSRAYFDSEIGRYQSQIQQLTGRVTEGKDVAFASKEELPLLWCRLGELYLERNVLFNVRGLNFGLQSMNVAIHMLLTPTSPSSSLPTPEEVDQKTLFRVLLNRGAIHTKMNREAEAHSDLERALMVASTFKDEYDMRSLKSSALLQQAYLYLTLKNKPMEAMLMLNESLMLNPCANLNTETHSKLVYTIERNEYFDADDWEEFVTNVLLRDFGDDGIKGCANFLALASDTKAFSKDSKKNYVENEVQKIVQSINVNWILYNVYKASGKSDIAWSHLQHAHYVDRKKFGTRVDDTLRKIADDTRDIMELYDDEDIWIDRSYGSNSSMPVFIVGFFRSGSTLLENMLVQHPSVGTLGESSIFVDHLRSLRESTAIGGSSLEKNEDYGNEYETSKREEEILQNHTNDYLKSIVNAIREDYPDKKVFRTIDKRLWNFRNLGVIQSMLPQSYIIHVIRDPLDTLLSCYKTQFKGSAGEWSSSESSLVQVYSEYLRLMQHFHNILPGRSERIILVTYESLVLNTKDTMKYILDALELPWSDKVLKTSLRKSKLAYTASLMQIKSSIYSTSVGGWRGVSNHLKTMKKELQKHDKLLKKMGKLMSNSSVGKGHKKPNRFYNLNWALDLDFDYSYPPSWDQHYGETKHEAPTTEDDTETETETETPHPNLKERDEL